MKIDLDDDEEETLRDFIATGELTANIFYVIGKVSEAVSGRIDSIWEQSNEVDGRFATTYKFDTTGVTARASGYRPCDDEQLLYISYDKLMDDNFEARIQKENEARDDGFHPEATCVERMAQALEWIAVNAHTTSRKRCSEVAAAALRGGSR